MNRVFTARQMRSADRRAAEAGVPSLLLMEAAGAAVAAACRNRFPAARRILILCGAGNNGGDGFAAARRLSALGAEPVVHELSEPRTADARTMRSAWLAHAPVNRLGADSLERALAGCDLVVDALLGSGLSRPLSGELAAIVAAINSSGLPVLAVDVPSGVASDEPVPPGPFVRATVTVQLAGPKLAGVFDPARQAFGAWEVADIGIPRRILEDASNVHLLEAGSLPFRLERSSDAHKYRAGTVLVVAGSSRYLGAAELACRGALRAGAGLVTLAARARLPAGWPEIIHAPVTDEGGLEPLLDTPSRYARAIVAGPGLEAELAAQLPGLLAEWPQPWVLDAGALRPGQPMRGAVGAHGACVLTPHAGEAARLLGVSAADVAADPLGSAAWLARDWNAVAVLKGSTTVVAAPDGFLAVSPYGHPGMASGGTGDVLAGVIGAFLAAPGGAALATRAASAVVVHGLSGEAAGRDLGLALLASDLVDRLPAALIEAGAG